MLLGPEGKGSLKISTDKRGLNLSEMTGQQKDIGKEVGASGKESLGASGAN